MHQTHTHTHTLSPHTKVLQITPVKSKVISSFRILPLFPHLFPPFLPSQQISVQRQLSCLLKEKRCSREVHTAAHGVSTRQRRRKGQGENPWRVALTHHTSFLALFLHLFLYLIPLTWAYARTHAHTHTHPPTHVLLACNLLGPPVGLLCVPCSPPSMLHLAVRCFSEDWKN